MQGSLFSAILASVFFGMLMHGWMWGVMLLFVLGSIKDMFNER